MRLPLIAMLTLGLAASASVAAPLDDALMRADRNAATALQELARVRERIASERMPLVKKCRALEAEVAAKRRQLAELRADRQSAARIRTEAEARVAVLSNQADYIRRMLTEYRRNLEAEIPLALLEIYRPGLERFDRQLHAGRGIDDLASEILQLSKKVIADGIGGCRFEGSALDSAGVEDKGVFLMDGPVGWFKGERIAGLVNSRDSGLLPVCVRANDEQQRRAVEGLADGGSAGSLPVDVTGGWAITATALNGSFMETFRKGGVVMIPLLLTGLLAALLSLLKLADLRKMRPVSSASLDGFIGVLRDGDPVEIERRKKQLPEIMASLAETAFEYRGTPREHTEEILHEHILAMMPRFEKYLAALAVLAAVAPLLGLLGTVTGMMHTFDMISVFGNSNAQTLSGGISEALITTKFGLAIAIPVLLVHAWFSRKVRTMVAELENAAARLGEKC